MLASFSIVKDPAVVFIVRNHINQKCGERCLHCADVKMSTIDIKKLATTIRQLRESLYYSQEYMGVKLGIGQNAYSKIELGKCKLSVERLAGIASVLETDMITLLEPALGIKKQETLLEKVA